MKKKKGSWFRKTFSRAGCYTCLKILRKGYCKRMWDGADGAWIYCRPCAVREGYGKRPKKVS